MFVCFVVSIAGVGLHWCFGDSSWRLKAAGRWLLHRGRMWNWGHLGLLAPLLAFDLQTKPVFASKLEFIKETSSPMIQVGISNWTELVNVYPLSALSSSLAGWIGKCKLTNEPIHN